MNTDKLKKHNQVHRAVTQEDIDGNEALRTDNLKVGDMAWFDVESAESKISVDSRIVTKDSLQHYSVLKAKEITELFSNGNVEMHIVNLKHWFETAIQFGAQWQEQQDRWISVETPPVDCSTFPIGAIPEWWQVATDTDILLLPCEYYNGHWYAYGEPRIEDRVRWYKPLPKAPTK